MLCHECRENKLSREFPREPLTEECDHPMLHCLRCTVKLVEGNEMCPFDGCQQEVKSDSRAMALIRAILKSMFYTYTVPEPPPLKAGPGDAFFSVIVMNGERYEVPYKSETTVREVKKYIQLHHNHEVRKQRLMYNNKEVKSFNSGKTTTLSDYNIQPKSTVYLMVVLYAVPDDLKRIIFQLYWGVPAGVTCDFLDVSCFIFNTAGQKIGVIDYADETNPRCGTAIEHSGDEMDRVRRIGSHRIDVKLDDLPKDVSFLVFTLSAWDSPRVDKFKDPLLKVFDANNIFSHLCEKSLNEYSSSQAVVVCCVYRVDDAWTIVESGCQSTGNTDHYSPIENCIKSSVLPMCTA